MKAEGDASTLRRVKRDAVILVVGLAVAFASNPPLLLTPIGLALVPAGVLVFLGLRSPVLGFPRWAMWVWLVGALWVGFINIFGGWFVSQM